MIDTMKSFFDKYFSIGANNWAITVKISIMIVFFIGIFWGAIILLKIL